MSKPKIKGSKASKIEVILGAILIVIFFSGCSNEFLMDKIRLMAASFVFLGAYFIARGLEWGQLIKQYRAYEALLANDPSGSLSTLASATKSSVKDVKRTLRLMIKRGMTGPMTIDEGADRAVGVFSPTVAISPKGAALEKEAQQPGATTSNSQPNSAGAPSCEMVVSCPSCGARNSMPLNAVALCGHCGAKIKSE